MKAVRTTSQVLRRASIALGVAAKSLEALLDQRPAPWEEMERHLDGLAVQARRYVVNGDEIPAQLNDACVQLGNKITALKRGRKRLVEFVEECRSSARECGAEAKAVALDPKIIKQTEQMAAELARPRDTQEERAVIVLAAERRARGVS